MSPWVAELSTAEATVLPAGQGTFTLITSLLSLSRTPDPVAVVRGMLRLLEPGGRLILADLVRTRIAAGQRDRIERLRDPAHTTTRTIDGLAALVTGAGGDIRRLEVFTIERPIAPWLDQSPDPDAAERIRDELMDELDGGPATGTRPRLVGGELWFTQSWAYIAAQRGDAKV
jgi:SAM-dependent methyltransferase